MSLYIKTTPHTLSFFSPVDCGFPPYVPEATPTYENTTYLSVAEYSCDYGYAMNGTNTTTCRADGEWNALTFTCQGT